MGGTDYGSDVDQGTLVVMYDIGRNCKMLIIYVSRENVFLTFKG